MSEFTKCEFCGCNTNAKQRRCCEKGYEASLHEDEYRAEFLWPHEDGSLEEAGYEFANGKTRGYQELWWGILLARRDKLHTKATDPCLKCQGEHPAVFGDNGEQCSDHPCEEKAKYEGAEAGI